jgi:hypothetical protein
VLLDDRAAIADSYAQLTQFRVLRDYSPSDGLWPSQHIPRRLAAARAKYAE